jgi:hypothetical protein
MRRIAFLYNVFIVCLTIVLLGIAKVYSEDPPALEDNQSVVLSEGDRKHVRVFSTPEDGEMRTLTLQIEENHRAVGQIPSESGWSLSDGETNCMSGEEGGWHFGVSRCSGSCPEEVAIGFSGSPGSASGEQFVTTITGEIYTCGGGGGEGSGGVETFTLLITDDESAHISPNPAYVAVSTSEDPHWVKLTAKRFTESGSSDSGGEEVVVDWKTMDDVDFAGSEGGTVLTDTQVDAREETFIWAKSTRSGEYEVQATTLGDSEGSGLLIEGILNVASVKIKKVWSNQFEGNECYFLPGGHGAEKDSTDDFLLVGERDDEFHLKAKIEKTAFETDSSPPLLFGFAYLVLEHSGTKKYVPSKPFLYYGVKTVDYTFDEAKQIATIFSKVKYSETNFLVAGYDYNLDGDLTADEVGSTEVYPIIFVSKSDYVTSAGTTWALYGVWAGSGLLLPALHLGEFLNSNMTGDKEISLSMDDPRLEHKVGGGPPDGCTFENVKEFVYDEIEYQWLGDKIMESQKFNELIKGKLQNLKPSIIAYFNANPDKNTYTDSLAFNDEKLNYGDRTGEPPSDLYLWLSFGKVKLRGAAIFEIRKKDLEVVEISIAMTQADLYDWDYTLDSTMAKIQAGFGTLGQAGKIFTNKTIVFGKMSSIEGYKIE